MEKQGTLHIIKASAGSGKTYQLTKRYIRLLIGEPIGNDQWRIAKGRRMYHQHILAITFTNKATDEMKERIVKQLSLLSEGKGDYIADFTTQFINPIDDVCRAARLALEDILFNYSTFNVSTIDSFFQGVMRNFTHELDLDYNYEVQIDDQLATSTAVHNFLVDLGKTGKRRNGKSSRRDIDGWVRNFVNDSIERNDYSWRVFSDNSRLSRFAFDINKEFFRNQSSDIDAYLKGKASSGKPKIQELGAWLIKKRNSYRDAYASMGNKFNQLNARFGIDIAAYNGQGAIRNFIVKPSDRRAVEPPSAAFAALTIENIGSKSFKKSCIPGGEALENLFQLKEETVQNWTLWKFYEDASVRLGMLGMLGAISEKLEEFRHETNSILIADTNELIGKVVESPVPFIYERVGTWLDHYMIDEFQDTSAKQYANFKPLIKDSIDVGHDDLVIGDEKQAIYRFRNSDSTLLRDVVEHDFHSDSSTLDTNYRSCANVVEFNSTLFEKIRGHYAASYPGLYKSYKSIAQKVCASMAQSAFRGYVRINFALRKNFDAMTTDERIIGPNVKMPSKSYVLERLPQYLLALHERGYAWNDIVVLVDKRDDGTAVVQAILDYNAQHDEPEEKIGIMSGEALLLKNASCVRMVINVLRFLDATPTFGDIDETVLAPGCDEANARQLSEQAIRQKQLAKRLRNQRQLRTLQVFGKKLEAITGDADDPQAMGQLLDDSFSEVQQASTGNVASDGKLYLQRLKELLPKVETDTMNLVGLVEKIIHTFVLASIPSDNLTTETAYLQAFVNTVLEFAQGGRNGGTVREFLRYWDANNSKISVNASAGDDSINVMTIHKSKGLEFPCVVIPFANWELIKMGMGGSIDRYLWLDKPKLEQSGLFANVDTSLLPPLMAFGVTKVRDTGKFDPYYKEEEENSLIDNLNKTYVAFTRAACELHVFTNGNEVSKLLVSNLTGALQSDGSFEYFTMGQPQDYGIFLKEKAQRTQAKKAAGDGDEEIQVEAVAMPKYAVGDATAKVQISIPDRVSPEQDAGTRLHKVLSGIRHRSDVPHVMRQAAARRLFGNEAQDGWTQETVERMVYSLFDDERTRQWFADDVAVYNERSFLYRNGEVSRMDRIVRHANGLYSIIDYKFGKEEATHRKQVARYMRLLGEAVGLDKVRGYLLYLGHQGIRKVVPVAANQQLFQ